MKINHLVLALTLGLMLMACDDGSIPEKATSANHTGYTVKMIGNISGMDTWTSNKYNLVLAAFSDDSEYAIAQKKVSTTDANRVNITIDDVDGSAKTLELCVTDLLRRRVVTLKSIDITTEADPSDTIRLEVGSIDAGMLAVIQTGVFDKTCAQCHGGSTSAAADLHLTSGETYSNLVNVASTKVEGGVRVAPGDASSSVLHNVINPGNVAGLTFSHEGMISDDNVLNLIDEWINGGAKE